MKSLLFTGGSLLIWILFLEAPILIDPLKDLSCLRLEPKLAVLNPLDKVTFFKRSIAPGVLTSAFPFTIFKLSLKSVITLIAS